MVEKMKEIIGELIASEIRLGIVVSSFNEFITESLLKGALDSLRRHGGNPDEVTVVRVPGAFEIPLAAKKMAESGKYDALVCLGAVIRGATPHFDYVCSSATSGIADISLKSGVPVSFGLLTTDTIEQTIERAGTKAGNKGRDALLTAVEMVNLLKKL